MGDEELVAIERPFHIMNAVERTSAKLRTCAIDCRAFDRLREESIFDADVKGKFCRWRLWRAGALNPFDFDGQLKLGNRHLSSRVTNCKWIGFRSTSVVVVVVAVVVNAVCQCQRRPNKCGEVSLRCNFR
jgi:hypothetical protein